MFLVLMAIPYTHFPIPTSLILDNFETSTK